MFVVGAGIGALALSVAFPTAQAFAEPPNAIPASVDGDNAKWQPVLDYDTDSCCSSPAIDAEGHLADGVEPTGGLSENCHDASDLVNTNTCARATSNNGWTAHLYDSCFEKDQSLDGTTSGHRHECGTRWSERTSALPSGESRTRTPTGTRSSPRS